MHFPTTLARLLGKGDGNDFLFMYITTIFHIIVMLICVVCVVGGYNVTTLNQETPRRPIETVYSLLWSKCNVTGVTDEKRS